VRLPGALWLWASAAKAEEEAPPWWIGLPVADVSLSAPEGGLPEESLEPLLRVREGEPLDPHGITLDLTTLFQVGEFSGVEANVEPWVTYDAQGDSQPGALLTYIVHPAPKIEHIRIQGNRRFRDRVLLAETGLAPGQVFYADLDGPFAEDRLESWMKSQGYLNPSVTIRSTEPEPGAIFVVVVVEEGQPNTLTRLSFSGDFEGITTEAQLRRWARREGLEKGEPVVPNAVARAQEAIRAELGAVNAGLFRPARGWISARVTPAVVPTPKGERVNFAIEPGPRLKLEITGLGWFGRRLVKDALGIDHRLRITRGFLDQAPDQLRAVLQERGWYAAEVAVTHEPVSPEGGSPEEELQRLVVDVRLGSKHTMGDLRFVDVDFTFVDPAEDENREENELQSVFDQTSPEVLRRDIYTVPEMEAALEAARQFYVDRGRLAARLTLEPPRIEPRQTLENVRRRLAGMPLKMKITPRVTVEHGPLTHLRGLSVEGAAEGVDLSFVEEETRLRSGQPFSPQQIDALAQRVVQVHREQGWLEADVRVQHTEVGDNERSSVIVVDPGPQVLLRSVVARGTRLTKPSFVQNEVDLTLGEPITSTVLEATRTDLYELGIFESVDLALLGDGQARDLVVTLDEANRWAFEAGGGVSTDQGLRALGRATRRNLFGRAQRLELIGQVGFEYRSDDPRSWLPDFTRPEWRAAISYRAPRFPLRSQDLVVDLILRERRQERTWRMDRSGLAPAIEWHLGKTRLRGGTRVEVRQLNQVDGGALIPGEPWRQQIGPRLELGEPPLRVQESVTGLWVHDWRDDIVQPTRGALVSANVEWVPGLPWAELGQELSPQQPFLDQPLTAFVKSDLRFSTYVPLWGVTLHVALFGGYIHSFAGVPPLEDRYRLGGTGSLRGFVRDGIGPHNITPPLQVDWPAGLDPVIDYALRDEPDRWTPTGGDTTASGTFELLMPLPALGFKGWEGYALDAFVDVGNVWLLQDARVQSDQEPYRTLLPALRLGVGLGLRVDTPIGPLQVDLAANPQVWFSSPARRALLVEGWREPPGRAHLTLGALF
jgi:outer membrane protein assembly factor BamA